MVIPDSFWAEELLIFEAMLYKFLLDTARLGAANALPGGAGVGINWALVNKNVAAWAARYTAELVKGITATTKTATQAAIAAWIESGNPIDDLFVALEPLFGADRAEMIAVTEVTQAYQAGNLIAWREAGASGWEFRTSEDDLVCEICGPLNMTRWGMDDESNSPPRHPRCRCWSVPVIELP